MTALTLAGRLREVEGSPTLALAAKAKALAKAGKSVVDLTAGEPDMPTPEPIKQAGTQAIAENKTRYTPVAGIPELRDAVSSWANKQYGTSYQASQVLVSCGAKHSLYNIFQAICQEGDEVVIFSPYWVSYPPMVRLAGATPVIVETTERDAFLPDPAALKHALTPATKAVILNSPSNPTGAVIDEDRLRAIARLAHEHGFVIVSDEIYDQLVYAPAKHRSILHADGSLAEQTVIVGGMSKTYSMTGWRIGYALGPKTLIEAMDRIQSHSTSNPTSISQYAALAGLTGPQDAVAQMVKIFQARRDKMVAGFNALPGLRCFKPLGAFYLWCDVSGLGQSSDATAAQWLDDIHVATVPGEGFGAPGWLRLSFAAAEKTLDEGLSRIGNWLSKRGKS